MLRVGICRGLDGVRFLSRWQEFLESLDCRVVISPGTHAGIIKSGVRLAPAELCLPVKAFIGHALALRSEVDRLMVPRMVCVKPPVNGTNHRGRQRTARPGGWLFGCPKTIALPDMLRALIPDLPPLVELRVDERERPERQAYLELAAAVGADRRKARAALARIQPPLGAGLGHDPISPSRNRSCPAPNRGRNVQKSAEEPDTRPVVALVGHEYLIDDEGLSLGLPGRVAEAGARVVRGYPPAGAANADRPGRSGSPAPIVPATPAFLPDWLYERELIEQALAWAARPELDGLILAASFACGTSAVTNEIIRRTVARSRPGLAVMELMFDEQTGPAGLTTRLESFVELLRMGR